MKFRKIAAMALCAVAVAGMVSGCSKKEEPAPTGQEEQSEGTSEVFRVGMECAYAPYNWTQTDDANGAVPIKGTSEYANGYDVMMAKKIAESMGATLEINKIEWDGLAPSVAADKIDAAIAGMSITSERLQTVDFTEPYYYANIVAITTKGSPYENAKSVEELDGAICTSQLNTIWYDMIDQIPNAKKEAAMENVAAMIVALTSGKVNVVVTDIPTAMAAQYSNSDIVVLDFSEGTDFVADQEDINIGIAIKKGNTALKEKIDAALANMTEDDFSAMMQEAIENQPLAQ